MASRRYLVILREVAIFFALMAASAVITYQVIKPEPPPMPRPIFRQSWGH